MCVKLIDENELFWRLAQVKREDRTCEKVVEIVVAMPTIDVVPRKTITELGDELRSVQKGIINEDVLTGYNIAVAICNKYLTEKDPSQFMKSFLKEGEDV